MTLYRVCSHFQKGHTCTLHSRSNRKTVTRPSEMMQRPYESFPTRTPCKRLMLVVPGRRGPVPSFAGEIRALSAALRMRSEPWTRPYHRHRGQQGDVAPGAYLTPVSTRRQLNLHWTHLAENSKKHYHPVNSAQLQLVHNTDIEHNPYMLLKKKG